RTAPPGVDGVPRPRPAAERHGAFREGGAPGGTAQPPVRYLGRPEAVNPDQLELLPDGAPAPPNPHCQVLSTPRKPDSIIRTMNKEGRDRDDFQGVCFAACHY